MFSSQNFIPIEDIRDDIVYLKNGSASLIIETSAVNFGLLFETEQSGIIQAFAGLLNSLSFPIQIVVLSKRLDVSTYLKVLDKAHETQNNPLLKNLTAKYRQFVENLIKERDVLDKRFFVCITASYLEMGLLIKTIESRLLKSQNLLYPRADHIARQLGRLGLKSKVLFKDELVKLFYEEYNFSAPELAKAQTIPKLTPVSTQTNQTIIAPKQPPAQPQTASTQPIFSLRRLPSTQIPVQSGQLQTPTQPVASQVKYFNQPPMPTSTNPLLQFNPNLPPKMSHPFVVEELT